MTSTKNSIAFDCYTCGRGIVRDSEDHDQSACDEDNDDNWYCPQCFSDFIDKKEAEKKPTQEQLNMMKDLGDSFMTWAMDKYMTEEEKVECTQANKSMSEIWDMLKPRHLIAEEEYCEEVEGIMHCCIDCDYELTDAQFCEGKGRVMFCADNGIGEGEYRCGVCDPRCSDADGFFPDSEEKAEKKPKKKKKRKRLVIVDKLCKSTPCQLIKDEEWNMKCSMCDGYYKDDGLHDILHANDYENCSCKLCGNSAPDVVIMKGTGSCVCARGCDDDEEDLCECDVCGEELDDDIPFGRLYGSVWMTFCKECYDNKDNHKRFLSACNDNEL